MTRPAWRILAADVAGYEPEDDADLLAWMARQAAGMAGYATAITTLHGTCTGTGLSPAALSGIRDTASTAASAAGIMADARRAFAGHYAAIREYAASGGILPRNGRWITGEEPAPSAAPSRPPAAVDEGPVAVTRHDDNSSPDTGGRTS